MFPTAHSTIYRNEEGEVLGWSDESSYEPDYDPYDGLENDPVFTCKCGGKFWEDDVDEILAHYEICDEAEWFLAQFPDELAEVAGL